MKKHIQVAIGSILGDGCLTYLSKRKNNSQLYVSQHKSKLAYLEWLYQQLETGFVMNPIKPKKGYEQYYLTTKPHKDLGKLMMKFYPDGKKIIPVDIQSLLISPISLAVWYMDDGTLDNRLKNHKNSLLATYCFSFDDCHRLSKAIKINFGVEMIVTKCTMRGKLYPRLYVKSTSQARFLSIVNKFVQPVFRYKMGYI